MYKATDMERFIKFISINAPAIMFPGNYAYGHLKENGRFVVEYVGRSDTDLNDRIKHGIGSYDIRTYEML